MRKCAAFIVLSLSVFTANAENIIRAAAPIQFKASPTQEPQWVKVGVDTGPWAITGSTCASWLPDSNAYETGTAFTQTGSDCFQTESRLIRDILQNSLTGATKVAETATPEQRSINIPPQTRSALGTGVAQWNKTGLSEGPWVVKATTCSSWSPALDTVELGKEFTQTGSTCSQTESRTLTDILTNSITGLTKLADTSTDEERVVNVASATRTSVGTGAIFSASITAGRSLIDPDSFVGQYARTNIGVDIGTKTNNEYGDRVMVYAYKNSGNTVCQLRIAVSGPSGWKPGAGGAPVNAEKFLNRYNKVTMKDVNGAVLLSATLGAVLPASPTEGAIFRGGNVGCSAITTLYNSPTTIKSVTAEY